MALILRTLSATFFDGHHIAPHSHPWGQLIYAASGVMRVRAGDMLWVTPPAQAVWAPAGARHEIWARGEFAMRTLYLREDLARTLPADCRGLQVSPLLRELILHAAGLMLLEEDDPSHQRIAELAAEQIAAAPALPLNLPFPRDARALKLARRLQQNPADAAELAAMARDAGASVRTLQRLFLDETGLRIAQWRQRLRLLHAASVLGLGASVTDAGLEAGYGSSSAFIAAFRNAFGSTPGRFAG